MLPDYPMTKAKFTQAIKSRIRGIQDQLTRPFSEAQRVIIHEGERTTITRADGSVDDDPPVMIASELTLTRDEICSSDLAGFLRKVDEMAVDMSRQAFGFHLGKIDKAVKEVGNVVDVGGHPLTPENVLELWEKIEVEFDEQGRPDLPTLMAHPSMAEKIKRVLQEFATNPVYVKRHAELIERKREEWRDRESARKLVG